jgi:hypothetical protein
MARLIFAGVLFASMLGLGSAEAVLIDDFNDGDDLGWVYGDNLASGGPPIFDASSGRYRLSSTSPVNEDESIILASWAASLGSASFSNSILTARVRADNENSSVGLALRTEPGSLSGYGFAANHALDLLLVSATDNWNHTYLASVPFTLNSGTEYFLQAGSHGTELTFKVWEVSSPEPGSPQVTVNDATFTVGGIGLAAYSYGGPGVLSASFDNVTFTPEPSTSLLLACGLAGLAAGGRRRRL